MTNLFKHNAFNTIPILQRGHTSYRIWYVKHPMSWPLTVLIMVNTLGHTIEIISTLKILRMILWVHIIHQPTSVNIKGRGVIGSNNSIGLKLVCIKTQPMGALQV